MTPKQFYYSKDKQTIIDVSEAAGTKFSNFKQIAVSKGSVSAGLAERLEKSSGGEMTVMEILFPERFDKSANSTQETANI